jgi:hypothetical protein
MPTPPPSAAPSAAGTAVPSPRTSNVDISQATSVVGDDASSVANKEKGLGGPVAPAAGAGEKTGEPASLAPGEHGEGHDLSDYPQGYRLGAIVVALVLSIFLVALDMTIVATAIPKITDEFKGLDKVSWYGAAFFMCVAAFQSTCKCLISLPVQACSSPPPMSPTH